MSAGAAWARPLGAAALILALPFILGALSFEAPPPSPGPAGLVQAIDSAAAGGDWTGAHAGFDYRARGRSMVPDLWDEASEADRTKMVEFLKSLFRATWERSHKSDAFAKGLEVRAMRLHPNRALVDQTGFSEDGTDHTLRYWLEGAEGTWRIVNRTQIKDGVHHEPSTLIKVLRGRIRGQLGRKPTLGEFAINAPSWLEQIRVRTIRADDLLNR